MGPSNQFKRVPPSQVYIEERLEIIKMFTTCVKKIKNFLQFSRGKVSLSGKCPYPKSEGWKQKQYFLRAPASCQNGLLLAENIKVSSVEINVNKLS